jgi:serine protease Do
MRLHLPLLAALVLSATWGDLAPRAGAAHPRRTPVVEAVERVRAAVVNIHSERTAQGFSSEDLLALAPSQNRVNGMGTGVLIDPRGYVLTNQHVVEDVNVIRVRLSDGTAAAARVLTRDPETDLALLKIDVGRPLPTIPLGTAADLMVGETVIAIGNAYGYEHTVSVGVVSAVKRDVTLNKELSYKALIQTDASINPGNSGGPLVNVHGELVGVNVAIRAGAQGIGFAIPVDTVLRVAADMMSIRKRNGTWHGLVVTDLVRTPKEGQADEACPARSLVVERVEANGPAARLGLQRGDVVVQAADARVSCCLDLERALLPLAAGDKVPLVVRRNGKEERVELVVQAVERPAPSAADVVWRKLGVRLSPVGGEVVARTNPKLHGGLAVVEVRPDGAAARAGIQRGDIVVGLREWEMLTLDNVLFVLTHPELPSFKTLQFYIIRAGQVHQGWLPAVE